MGKSDEKQTKMMRAHSKATTDFGMLSNKHNNKATTTITDGERILLVAATFEATDNDASLRRHSQWRENFRQMCDYKAQYNHCLVPNRFAGNPKLGRWVAAQRTRYRKKNKEENKSTSMTAEHIRALNAIGFDWGTSKSDIGSIWSVRFQQLCDFKEEFGHCVVPQHYVSNNKLGRWVSTQRSHYKLYQEGKPTTMTAERIRELQNIGFEYNKRNNWSTTPSCSGVKLRLSPITKRCNIKMERQVP